MKWGKTVDNQAAKAFWDDWARVLSTLVEQMGDHLPGGADHPSMDGVTADEIVHRMHAARAAADMAAGAFGRVTTTTASATREAASAGKPPRPAPAVVNPPLRTDLPANRGWPQ